MEQKVTLEFTLAEIGVLRQLIHIATQARGLEVAEPAVAINQRISAAVNSIVQPNGLFADKPQVKLPKDGKRLSAVPAE